MNLQQKIDLFLTGAPHAVVGASRDRAKYGNKVLRCYLQSNRDVFPVNPHVDSLEGLTTYPDLASLPESVHGVSVVTPPHVTETVVEQAAELGIQNLWMQPGAENTTAVARAKERGINLIHGGPCLLVVLGFRES